jgi:hypothetical protein
LERLFHTSFVFGVSQENTVNLPPNANSEIVHICKPFLAQSQPTATTRCIDAVHDISKVVGTIRRTKSQAHRQKLTGASHNRKHTLSTFSVHHLVEAGAGIDKGHPDRPRHFSQHVTQPFAIVNRARHAGVHPPVVDYQAAFSGLLVSGLIAADRKRGTSPRRVSAN